MWFGANGEADLRGDEGCFGFGLGEGNMVRKEALEVMVEVGGAEESEVVEVLD